MLVPGARYSVDGPLLMYAGIAVQRRGGTAHGISWVVPGFSDDEEERAWVVAQVRTAVSQASAIAGAPPLVIAKSLGTLAAPVAAEWGLAAIWLTPLLSDRAVVAALGRAERPCLLVGGTDDESWDGAIARSITPHVLEVQGADHGMLVPGGLSESAAVLGRVMTAVEQFLDRAWAGRD